MRERQRREREEPPEPTKPPPTAPKPKPLPRGPPSVEDDLSEKGHPDSINDSFEDVPDRKSKIEKIHGVPTPLSAVLQKSMEEKSDHEHEHEEDSNSHGPPGYMTDDPEDRRRQVCSIPDIDHSSMYLFSYPSSSSVDSNLTEVCGDYDASKPLSAHRHRTASGSYITKSCNNMASDFHTSVTSIPQDISGAQFEEIHGSEKIYQELSRVKRDKSSSNDDITKKTETKSVSQPRIYGRRSRHYTKNQKQKNLATKLVSSQPSLQNVAMASLLPCKAPASLPTSKTPPLYAKINKDTSLKENPKAVKNKASQLNEWNAEELTLDSSDCPLTIKQTSTSPSQNRDKIREELKMYILSPQTNENRETVSVQNDSYLDGENEDHAKSVEEVDSFGKGMKDRSSKNNRNIGLQLSDQTIAANSNPNIATSLSEINHIESETPVTGEIPNYILVDSDAKGRSEITHECLFDTTNVGIKHSDRNNPYEYKSPPFLFGGNSKIQSDVNQATREWIEKIEPVYELNAAEETENVHNLGVESLIEESDTSHTKTEVSVVTGLIRLNGSIIDSAESETKVEDNPLMSPAIVVSDCDGDGNPAVVSPYQIVFDSSIKVMLGSSGQEIDIDTHLEKFSTLSSGSSDMEMPFKEKDNIRDADRLSTTSDQDRDLERFSTISSESSDLELKYGRKNSADDRDLSLEQFCTLSTDSSEGDYRARDVYQHGAHLTIPTKVLKKKQKKQVKKVEEGSSSNLNHEKPDSYNSLRQKKENLGSKNDTKLAQPIFGSGRHMSMDKAEIVHSNLGIKQSEDLTNKPNLVSLPSDGSFTKVPAKESIENTVKVEKNLKHNKSKGELQPSLSESVPSLPVDDRFDDSSVAKNSLKKSKSKDKLGSGLSCMKPRTTSPFEVISVSKSNCPEQETVKTEKPNSVYKKVARQLSKTFVKKKSKSKIIDEVEKNEQQLALAAESVPYISGSVKNTQDSDLSDKRSSPGYYNNNGNVYNSNNLARPRYNKPDWFKTYLLPDDQKTSSSVSSEANEQTYNRQSEKLNMNTGVVVGNKYDYFPTDTSRVSETPLGSVVTKHGIHRSETHSANDLEDKKRKHLKESDRRSNVSKADHLLLGIASKKKVSPGVIHMLNPCTAGWLEGGLDADKCIAANPIKTVLERNGDNIESKIDSEYETMQVSALDFDLTASGCTSDIDDSKMKVNEMTDIGRAGSSYNQDRLPENCPDNRFDNLNIVPKLSRSHTENMNADKGTNNLYLREDNQKEVTSSQSEEIHPCHPVEDRLCHRKWTYKAGKDQKKPCQSNFTEIFDQEQHKTSDGVKSDQDKEQENEDCKGAAQSCHKKNESKKTDRQYVYIHNSDSDPDSHALATENAIDRVEQKLIVDLIILDKDFVFEKQMNKKVTNDIIFDKECIIDLKTTSSAGDDHHNTTLSGVVEHQTSNEQDNKSTDMVIQTKDKHYPETTEINETGDEEDKSDYNDIQNDKHSSSYEENGGKKNDSGDGELVFSDVRRVESQFPPNMDPLDDGNIPYADEDSAYNGGLYMYENEVSCDLNKTVLNTTLSNQLELLCSNDWSIDPILCECNSPSINVLDKTHEIPTMSRSYSPDENLKTKKRQTDIQNAEVDSQSCVSDKRLAGSEDVFCSDDITSTILCECNFRSVQVTDLDGASWFEEDGEIEPKCSYTDDRVPVVIEETPFVPKKRILKSSFSADNITKVGRKKGVRFHSNLPTWKKNSWRSESSLRRACTDSYERDDEKEKKKYIQNFIMCMFEQEPRNLALMGEVLDKNDKEDNFDFDSGNEQNVTDDNKADGKIVILEDQRRFQSEPNEASDVYDDKEKELLTSNAKDTALGHHIDETNFDDSNFEQEGYDGYGLRICNNKTESAKPYLHGSTDNEFTVQKFQRNSQTVSDASWQVKPKKPSVIAKQLRPHSPKFLVPISHQRSHNALEYKDNNAQISGHTPRSTNQPRIAQQLNKQDFDLIRGDRELVSFDDSKIEDSISSKVLFNAKVSNLDSDMEGTKHDNTQAYGMDRKPYTDWQTYLRSYEDFRKKIDTSVVNVEESAIDVNKKIANNPNTCEYADVSLIGIQANRSSTRSGSSSTHEGFENMSKIKSGEMGEGGINVGLDTVHIDTWADASLSTVAACQLPEVTSENNLQAHEKLENTCKDDLSELEYTCKDDLSEHNLGQSYIGNEISKVGNDSLFDYETSKLSRPKSDTDSQSSFSGRTTRYIFTLPDESDPECPKIKSVTYEYITEYKLNKVKVDYQHSKTVQTENDPYKASVENN